MLRIGRKSVKWLCLEPLEARRLLAISVGWNGSSLVVTGDDSADSVLLGTIQSSQTTYVALRDGSGQVLWNGEPYGALVSYVTQLTIVGGGGNDLIDAHLADIPNGFTGLTQVTLEGGSGNDTLYGSALPDQLLGGADADLMNGHGGADTLVGGKGDDTVYGGDGGDLFDDIGDGGEGNDRLYGEAGNDLIRTGKGDDNAEGGGGNDTLFGGDGSEGSADSLSGGDGNDLIHGDDGNDFIVGGEGNDTLHGDNGNDLLVGEIGDDELRGGSGFDLLAGGGGADLLFGESDEDLLLGGLTDFGDNTKVALAAIAKEWGSGTDYQLRVSRVSGEAGGANAPYFLTSATLDNDQNANSLDGGNGTDWCLPSASDQSSALEPGEIDVFNRRPTSSGLTSLVVSPGGASTVDLHAAFADSEDSDNALVYSVTSNSNPAFFSAITFNASTGLLTLTYAANAFGSAHLSVTATDTHGFSVNTPLAIQVPNLPPSFVSFEAEQMPQSLWSFSGQVSDESPGGLAIVFGGLLDGYSTTTSFDGSFAIDVFLDEQATGWVTALVTDSGGMTDSAEVLITLT